MDGKFSALTMGGTPKSEIESMGESIATLVLGRSLNHAADALKRRTGVPDFRFDHLMGLDACDAFTHTLAALSGQPVPNRIERQRAQLQDAMVDTHFQTGFARVGLALDADHLIGFAQFLTGMGVEIVAAVAPARAEVLADMPCNTVRIGDLEDLEHAAADAQLIISNSLAFATADRERVNQHFGAAIGFAIYSLDDEQERHVRENLSEEELVIFDILTRPAPELTTAGRCSRRNVRPCSSMSTRAIPNGTQGCMQRSHEQTDGLTNHSTGPCA